MKAINIFLLIFCCLFLFKSLFAGITQNKNDEKFNAIWVEYYGSETHPTFPMIISMKKMDSKEIKLFFGNTNGFKILNTELNNLNFYDLINQYVVTKVDFLKILNEFKGYFSKESEVEIGKSFGVSVFDVGSVNKPVTSTIELKYPVKNNRTSNMDLPSGKFNVVVVESGNADECNKMNVLSLKKSKLIFDRIKNISKEKYKDLYDHISDLESRFGM